MITTKDIINHVVDGELKTCIKLGRDDFGLPKHLMQGEKKCGYLLKNGELIPHYWEGLVSIDGYKYVYFPQIDILPVSTIATCQRANALKVLREFAYVISKAPASFASLESEVFPLWRLYILPEDGVLVLSEDISNIFAVMQEEHERKDQIVDFLKRGNEKGFTLISQFTQLLYYSLTSIMPYADDDVRNHRYNEIPLNFFRKERFENLKEESIGFINFVLHAKSREMRDIEGNRTSWENLEWFITRTSALDWSVENLNDNDSTQILKQVKETAEYKAFEEKTIRGAKRTRFWRVKGTIIIISAIALVCILGFGIPYVKSFFDPPYTKLLTPKDMVYAFYDGQNSLDVDKLTGALKKTKAPQETEVINLFVTTRMRYANEGFEPVVRADKWVENGKPAIYEQAFVYGVSDLEVIQEAEDTFVATSIWYTPYAYEESEESAEKKAGNFVYTYKVTQRFTFTWNKRGWYNITALDTLSSEYLGEEVVETFSR